MVLAFLLASSLQAEAQEFLKRGSYDPAAVQFEDVVEGDGIVCGRVNYTNKYGGYMGFQPFAYAGPKDIARDKGIDFVGVSSEGYYDTESARDRMMGRSTMAGFKRAQVESERGYAHAKALFARCPD